MGFAIAGVRCFADTFMQGGSSVIRMKFSANNPRHRKPPKTLSAILTLRMNSSANSNDMTMKKLLIIITMLFTLSAKAQTLVDTNKIWNVVVYLGFSGYYNHTYKFIGDTTIGINQYKKLYETLDTTLINWTCIGAMRDSLQRIFFHDFSNEYLYYDFSLNANDSFNTSISGCVVQMFVDSVDTVTLLNGELRRQLFLIGNFGVAERWIEGIGSLYGLMHVGNYLCTTDTDPLLNCFTENDTLKYKNTAFNSCYYTTVGIEEIKQNNSWSLYPNPFRDFSTLDFHNFNLENKTLKIFDAQGRLTKIIYNIKSGQVKIDRGELQNGFYFFELRSEKGLIANGKLVVQ